MSYINKCKYPLSRRVADQCCQATNLVCLEDPDAPPLVSTDLELGNHKIFLTIPVNEIAAINTFVDNNIDQTLRFLPPFPSMAMVVSQEDLFTEQKRLFQLGLEADVLRKRICRRSRP